jgi:DNA polymerase-3 subunit gamma/tau
MAAQALYRKWRSRTFEEVIAQEHVTRTLRNALRAGRVAHAYLFTGPRGTGKTSTARLLAKAVNCRSEDEEKPCNACAICQAIDEGRMLDLIEIDAASNRGIDEIRDLREKVNFRPGEARYKFYIIDEVHMLTNEAFNALLKTLEEPPPHVIFVLATTEPHKIPATVLSRCQRFDFRRIPLDDILSRLSYIATEEGLAVEPPALEMIARQSTGSLRDAVSLLDQMMAYATCGVGEAITLAHVQEALGIASSQLVADLVDRLAQRDVPAGLEMINRAIDEGAEPRQLAREIVEHLRGLMLLQLGNGERLLNLPAEVVSRMKGQAAAFSPVRLRGALQRFNQVGLELKAGFLPQLPLELAFVESATEEAVSQQSQPQPVKEQTAPAASQTPEVKSAARRTSAAEARKETPAATTPPAAPQARQELSLSSVQARWNDVLAALKRQGQQGAPDAFQAEGLLRSGHLAGLEGSAIVFAISSEVLKGKVEEPRTKALIEQTISQVMGSSCYLRCVPAGRAAEENAPPAQSAAEGKTPPPASQADLEAPVGKAGEGAGATLENDPVIEYARSELDAQVTILED